MCLLPSPPPRSLLRQSHAVPRRVGRLPQRHRRLLWIQAAQELEGKRRKTLRWNQDQAIPARLGPQTPQPACLRFQYAYRALADLE